MTHFVVSAMGLPVGVTFADATPSEVVERARAAWSDSLLGDDVEPVAHATMTDIADADRLLERLSVEVTLAALKTHSGSMLMFHAAGIANDDGRVIAFIGPSGRGKTTLSRFIAQHFGYASDETMTIAEDLTVHPYRKPLSIITDPKKPKEQIAPSALGLRPLPDTPLSLQALVLLDRVTDEIEPSLTVVGLPENVTEVVGQMSYLPELERPLRRLTGTIEATGGLRKLTYSSAESVLPLVQALFAEQPQPPAEPVADQPWVDPVDADEVLDFGDSLLVLRNRMIQVLSGIAPEVWRQLATGGSVADAVAAVIAQYGPPPQGNAEELVEATIEKLREVGLVASSAAS